MVVLPEPGRWGVSLTRRPSRRDPNHAEIVRALKAAGCSVLDLSGAHIEGCPDLLVGYRGRNVLLELKAASKLSSGAARSLARQEAWAASWRGERVYFVTTVAEAFSAVGAVAA